MCLSNIYLSGLQNFEDRFFLILFLNMSLINL